MTNMLRPLLPLLMLIPLIAIAGAARAATPAEAAQARPALVSHATLAVPIRATTEASKAERVMLTRIFAMQGCVRAGNRMVC